MALIDVVKCDIKDGEFVNKFPSEDLRIGTQLVVHPAQTAFFVKGGTIYDEFPAGTYTIKTENVPLLNKAVNLPFGGDAPFVAEVWFINQVAKLDIKWGTPQPLQLEDPRYKIIVPVRAFGQYGVKIVAPRLFLETLIGNMTSFTTEKIDAYIKGKLITLLNVLIAQMITVNQVSVLDINTQLIEMSEQCQQKLNKTFSKYGIELTDFSIMSVNVPQDDPSIVKLKEAKDTMARFAVTGKDFYQMERSFDVLDKVAANEGAGGQFLAMGAGLSAGMGVGNTIGQMASQLINTNPGGGGNTPPPPPGASFYLYINGQQVPNQSMAQISNLLVQGVINASTLVWRAGMPAWVPLVQVPELAALTGQQATPPPPPVQP